jgi:hypothetical protein
MPRISPSFSFAHAFLVMVIICMSVVIVRTMAHPINPYTIDSCLAFRDDREFCEWFTHAGPDELRETDDALNGDHFSSL